MNKIEGYGHNVWIIGNRCFRCQHKWVPITKNKPKVCPRCKSAYWDTPKKKNSGRFPKKERL